MFIVVDLYNVKKEKKRQAAGTERRERIHPKMMLSMLPQLSVQLNTKRNREIPQKRQHPKKKCRGRMRMGIPPSIEKWAVGPASSIPPHLIPTPYLSTIFPSPFGPLPTGATLFHNAPPSVQLPQLFALTALSCALGPYQSHLLVGTETSQELPPARPALTLVAPRSVQVTELRLTVHTTREEVSQLRASCFVRCG
jgi:hypothetical protein